MEDRYISQKNALMQVLSKLLPFNNWDARLLEEAESAVGFTKGYNYIMFPGGLDEVVDYFEQWSDSATVEYLANVPIPHRVRDKILLALKHRIIGAIDGDKNKAEILNNYRHAHIKTVSYLLRPDNIPLSVKIAWRSCDMIWRYAGDKSTDFNFYSKRGLLLSVYSSSIMFFIADESPEFVDTQDFMADSLENIINITKSAKSLIPQKLPKLEDIPVLRLFS